MNKEDMIVFLILTEFVTEWQISTDEDYDRGYMSDKSKIMNKTLEAIKQHYLGKLQGMEKDLSTAWQGEHEISARIYYNRALADVRKVIGQQTKKVEI